MSGGVTYRPCPDCPGWQFTQAREFSDTGDGYYETFVHWVCACGNVDREQSRDVPKQPACGGGFEQ